MERVFDLSISPTEKLVLLAMADHASPDGSGCYPSVATLIKKTSLSRRCVQTAIRHMENVGFLVRVGQATGGRRLTTEYSISLDSAKKVIGKADRNSAARAPFPHDQKGAKFDIKRAQNLHEKGAKFDRKTECILIEPKTEPRDEPENCLAGVSVAEESSPNTPPKPDASATERAFSTFGFSVSFGHARFKSSVLRRSEAVKNGNLLEIMELVIVDLDGKVPPQWYEKKHALEKSVSSLGEPERPMKQVVEAHCANAVVRLEQAAKTHPMIAIGLRSIAQTLQQCVGRFFSTEFTGDLDSLDRQLCAIDADVFILLQGFASSKIREKIDHEVETRLRADRGRITAQQLALVEAQYRCKILFGEFNLQRLSLFYMTETTSS
jgi:hypothetical protein